MAPNGYIGPGYMDGNAPRESIRYVYVDRTVDCPPDPQTERAMQQEIDMLKRQLRAAQQQIFSLQRQRR